MNTTVISFETYRVMTLSLPNSWEGRDDVARVKEEWSAIVETFGCRQAPAHCYASRIEYRRAVNLPRDVRLDGRANRAFVAPDGRPTILTNRQAHASSWLVGDRPEHAAPEREVREPHIVSSPHSSRTEAHAARQKLATTTSENAPGSHPLPSRVLERRERDSDGLGGRESFGSVGSL